MSSVNTIVQYPSSILLPRITCCECSDTFHNFTIEKFHEFSGTKCFVNALNRDCPKCVADHFYCANLYNRIQNIRDICEMEPIQSYFSFHQYLDIPKVGFYRILQAKRSWKVANYLLDVITPTDLQPFSGAPVEVFEKALDKLKTIHIATLQQPHKFTESERQLLHSRFSKRHQDVLFGVNEWDSKYRDTIGFPYTKTTHPQKSRRQIYSALHHLIH